MKANILILIDTYAIGGPGKVILQFLHNGGKDVCVPVVAGFWRGPECSWQFREAVEASHVRFEVLRQRYAFDPAVIPNAARLVREHRIDLVESHGYKAHVVALALKLWLKLPWVAYVHGWTSENLKVELYNWLDRTLVRFADRIVPVSRDLGKRLRLRPAAALKMVCIPNATSPVETTESGDELRERLGVQANDMLLAVVGRLSPEKGQRDFIRAFSLISACNKTLKAVLVGDGQDREALKVLIAQLGLEEQIRLVGYQEQVSHYYRACDVVVIPSLREGMPMVALEAMMYARPIVATSVGGILEVVVDHETGRLVPPAAPEEMATALKALLNDPQERHRLGRAGLERALREFNPQIRVKRIAELYTVLLEKRGRVSPPQVKP